MPFNALHVFLIGLLGVVTANSFLSGQDNPPGKTSIQDSRFIAAAYTPSIEKSIPHPDFVLPSVDGGASIQLSKYRGKKVLLLHFASW